MSRRNGDWSPAVPPIVLSIVGVGLLALGWGTWPDPTVDSGRELYTAWRLSQGAVLYRDIAWLNGPLSPYVNSLLFRAFGVGLQTLVVANLAWLGLLTATLYRLLRGFVTRRAATLVLGVFLCVFALAQLVSTGNYNFVCPYSHEITHGLLLTVCALDAMLVWLRTGRTDAALVGGLLVGAAVLTKPETAVAGAAGAVTCLGLASLTSPNVPGNIGRAWLAVVCAALVPLVLAVAALSTAFAPSDALAHVLAPWRIASDPRVWSLPFYLHSSGLDQPAVHVTRMLKWSLVASSVAVGLLGLGMALRREAARRMWAHPAAAAVAVVTVMWLASARWWESASAFPVVGIVGFVGGVLLCFRRPCSRRGIPLAALSAVSLALLAKMPLAARVYHYGFALAVPAALVAALLLLRYLPALARALGGSGSAVSAAGGALLLGWATVHLGASAVHFSHKATVVGSGADRFVADLRGDVLNQCVQWIGGSLPRSSTVVALPEGAMVNYLTRRPSSIPYIVLMPLEMMVFGEERVLDALEASPPDAIVLIQKDTTEYGYPLFGSDYGVRTLVWVREHYRRALVIGDPPLRSVHAHFGVEILVRHDVDRFSSHAGAESMKARQR